MATILQRAMPAEMAGPTGLPGVAPCKDNDWLRIDEAYAGQMARREELLVSDPEEVLWADPVALDPSLELLDMVLGLLPGLGFEVGDDTVDCPDGRGVVLDRSAPLKTLGRLVQEDLCILQKFGDEHVLTGAVLCFPASWRLKEKAGRPLIAIHGPVADYGTDLARRVQRLFDGVRPGRPLWRFNRLWYDDAELFQPRSGQSPRRILPGKEAAAYIRSERQCILRLPRTNAVVFAIHTYVVATEPT